ncbi:MAG: NADP-dependent malic enzyme [Candidatus Omnitrophica bacterium]|nr:NADP-dependent malic enzyme [Candidatus Omnitrophota bacterium]MCM8777313.1 NADP-dependent malic enzyme [Candidatus Omnitrophota bacterium]
MADIYTESLRLHKEARGKIEIKSKVPLKNKRDLSLAYTPGVAEPCMKIKKDKSLVYEYTSKWNTVAVVTDGSAVLGLGNIGAEAALPVMEGKAVLFKEFGDVDAIPICIDSQDTEEIIKAVTLISPSFGGINLEDISAPRCFEIESHLIKTLPIPVFHDDQHGTAVVVLAALINALKLVNKKIEDIKIVINGAGAAGIAIVKFLHYAGVRRMLLCDRSGIICKDRKENMNFAKQDIIKYLLPSKKGTLADAMEEADVFIGVSGPDTVSEEMIRVMNRGAIVFAMSNPVPEIMPEKAKKAGAFIVGTGRSDMGNQINNLLAFPGIFRGVFDMRAKKITEKMKLAASYAIANYIPENKLSPDYIIPSALDKNVAKKVAKSVASASLEEKK